MEGQASEDLCKERCRKLIDELEDTVAAFEAVEQTLKQSITKVYISVSDSEPNRARSLEAIRQSVAAELDIDALRRGVKTLTRASQVETPRNPDCPEDFIADRRRLDSLFDQVGWTPDQRERLEQDFSRQHQSTSEQIPRTLCAAVTS